MFSLVLTSIVVFILYVGFASSNVFWIPLSVSISPGMSTQWVSFSVCRQWYGIADTKPYTSGKLMFLSTFCWKYSTVFKCSILIENIFYSDNTFFKPCFVTNWNVLNPYFENLTIIFHFLYLFYWQEYGKIIGTMSWLLLARNPSYTPGEWIFFRSESFKLQNQKVFLSVLTTGMPWCKIFIHEFSSFFKYLLTHANFKHFIWVSCQSS